MPEFVDNADRTTTNNDQLPGALFSLDNPKIKDQQKKNGDRDSSNAVTQCDLPSVFEGARDCTIAWATTQELDRIESPREESEEAAEQNLDGFGEERGSRTESTENPSARELEPLIGKDFAQKLSLQIRQNGINSLQDVISNYIEKNRLPGEKDWELVKDTIPAIMNQIKIDFKNIRVVQHDNGGLKFTELDSSGRKINTITYNDNGERFYQDKFGTDGRVTEFTRYNQDTHGRTIESVERYFLGSEKLQSNTFYFKDGKTKAMECVHEPGDSHEVTTAVYNPDGSMFASINRDLFMPEVQRRGLPDTEKEKKPFSLTLYGPNNKSVNLDLEGFREIQRKILAGAKAPEGISADKLRENLSSFAMVAKSSTIVPEHEAKNLAKEISIQIKKGGIGSLEGLLKKCAAKFINPDGSSIRITDPMVISEISRQLESDFKNIQVDKTKDGIEIEFLQLDSQGKRIHSVSYYADGPLSGEAEFDKDGKKTKEKIFIPRE